MGVRAEKAVEVEVVEDEGDEKIINELKLQNSAKKNREKSNEKEDEGFNEKVVEQLLISEDHQRGKVSR